MRYFLIFVSLTALAHSVIKFIEHDYGAAFGLLGGFGAWGIVTVNEWRK